MEEDEKKLHNYIEGAYCRWVAYAKRYIRRSRLPMNACEVVNDVVCTLLERDSIKMSQMTDTPARGGTELDFFVMRVIKINIYSPRSPFRYRRGPRCVGNSLLDVPMDSEGVSGVTKDDLHSAVWCSLHELEAPDIAKKVFIWKFFDGNPISKWPGPEDRRVLYRAYGRIFKKIVVSVRCKIAH